MALFTGTLVRTTGEANWIRKMAGNGKIQRTFARTIASIGLLAILGAAVDSSRASVPVSMQNRMSSVRATRRSGHATKRAAHLPQNSNASDFTSGKKQAWRPPGQLSLSGAGTLTDWANRLDLLNPRG